MGVLRLRAVLQFSLPLEPPIFTTQPLRLRSSVALKMSEPVSVWLRAFAPTEAQECTSSLFTTYGSECFDRLH